MSLVGQRLADPQQLSNALATIYTAPALQNVLITKCVFSNDDTAAHTITVELIKSGGAAGSASKVWSAIKIGPGESKECFELEGAWLNPGDFIQMNADAGSKVNLSVLAGIIATQSTP
jgi:hypothetical protein